MTRPFCALVFVVCLALIVSTAPGFAQEELSREQLAQEQNAAPGGPSPAAPPQAATPGSAQAPSDPVAGRVKYLHDRLRITPEQEPLWDAVAQAIRDNARSIVPHLRERLRARTSGSALDVLNSYEALGETQLEGLKKFIAVFDALYASLSESQKKIADAILREGPLNGMIGGIPELPAPFGSPLSFEFAVPYYGHLFGREPVFSRGPVFGRLGGPMFDGHPRPFLHFHGLAPPGRTTMRGFHR
jgi:protein CpxP